MPCDESLAFFQFVFAASTCVVAIFLLFLRLLLSLLALILFSFLVSFHPLFFLFFPCSLSSFFSCSSPFFSFLFFFLCLHFLSLFFRCLFSSFMSFLFVSCLIEPYHCISKIIIAQTDAQVLRKAGPRGVPKGVLNEGI